MKLNSMQVELALNQFEGSAIPDDDPLVPMLSELFGDHTFFLNSDGLNVVEVNESTDACVHVGTVVNIANWTDAPSDQSGTSRTRTNGNRRHIRD